MSGFCAHQLKALSATLFAVFAASTLAAQPASPPSTVAIPSVQMIWGVKVPMRDGTHLSATIYRPRDQAKPLPVIVTITPYVADRFHGVGKYFAEHGYVFAVVDCRGRGNSEGIFRPFKDDGPDGHDAIEWLAHQPYADGQAGMWGGSYGGMNQWSVAATSPPSLKTIVPASASLAGFDFPQYKNIFAPYMDKWVAFTSGHTSNNSWFGDREYWNGIYEAVARGGPLRGVDALAGNPNPIVQEWLDHPAQDVYWDTLRPTPAQYAAIGIPTLTIVGQYDADQPGGLEHYRRHGQARADHGARDYLIVGPWDHSGTREPSRKLGGLDLGEAAVVDLLALHVAWFDWIMKSAPRPAFLPDRVAWYTLGPDRWSHGASLAAASPGRRDFFLSAADAPASSVAGAGDLTATHSLHPEAPRSYRYDPLNYDRLETERQEIQNFLTDDRLVRHIHGDGLVYQTGPLPAGLTITGRPALSLFLDTNVPDTDVMAALFEVKADGTSIALGADLVRLRYRDSLRSERFMTPGKIERVVLADFPWISRAIAPGSRIRLVIEPVGSSIAFERSYNARKPVADQTRADAVVAIVSVQAGGDMASKLSLPTGAVTPP